METREDIDSTKESTWNLADGNLLMPVSDVVDPDSNHQDPDNVLADALSENAPITNSVLNSTFVIGLDKNIFDQSSSSKDVILIQKPSVKFDNEGKITIPSSYRIDQTIPGGSYIISFVDQDRGNYSWDQPSLGKTEAKQDDSNTNVLTAALCETLLGNEALVCCKTNIIKPESVIEVCQGDEVSLPPSFVQKDSEDVHMREDLFPQLETFNKTNIPEKSLPLKKKAKMKGSEIVDINHGELMEPNIQCTAVPSPSVNKPLHRNIKRPKGRLPGKRRCCYSDSEVSGNEETVEDGDGLNILQFQSMKNLLDHLKTSELIDDDFANLILSGLEEMKTDVFMELKNAEPYSSDQKHSYELLTFAFLLHFKRRKVYWYFRRGLKDKWPSVIELNDWKTLVNSKLKKVRRKIRPK